MNSRATWLVVSLTPAVGHACSFCVETTLQQRSWLFGAAGLAFFGLFVDLLIPRELSGGGRLLSRLWAGAAFVSAGLVAVFVAPSAGLMLGAVMLTARFLLVTLRQAVAPRSLAGLVLVAVFSGAGLVRATPVTRTTADLVALASQSRRLPVQGWVLPALSDRSDAPAVVAEQVRAAARAEQWPRLAVLLELHERLGGAPTERRAACELLRPHLESFGPHSDRLAIACAP